MSMNGVKLGREIAEAIAAIDPPDENASDRELNRYRRKIFEAMGKTIVAHIRKHAVVYSVKVTGVKPGPATRTGNRGKVK